LSYLINPSVAKNRPTGFRNPYSVVFHKRRAAFVFLIYSIPTVSKNSCRYPAEKLYFFLCSCLVLQQCCFAWHEYATSMQK